MTAKPTDLLPEELDYIERMCQATVTQIQVLRAKQQNQPDWKSEALKLKEALSKLNYHPVAREALQSFDSSTKGDT